MYKRQVQTEVKVDVEKKDEDLKILLKEGEKAKVQCQVEKQLTAPVRKGDVVGSVEYSLNGQIFGSYPVVAKDVYKRQLLSHVQSQPYSVMRKAGFDKKLGQENFCANIDAALAKAEAMLPVKKAKED